MEEVPEPFLQPCLWRHNHSAGRLLKDCQDEAPDFWTHHNEGFDGAAVVYRNGQCVQSSGSSAYAPPVL